jgi:protein TonB
VFALSAGTVAAQRSSRASASDLAATVGGSSTLETGGGVALSEGEVTVPARLLSGTPLVYPTEARRAGIEADVPLQLEVGVDGRVRASRVLSPAGYGLDDATLRAVAGYRFSPALRDGRPVPVRMRWTVQFRLQ